LISLRYHAVSIAAVFLALAVGVVLGASGVSERLLGAVTDQNGGLQQQLTAATAERDQLAGEQRAADDFAARVGPAAVRDSLTGQRVLVVTAGADPAVRDGLEALVKQAGATVSGQIALTDAFSDPARGDQLRDLAAHLLPAGAQLPTAADTGTLTGGLVGGTLFGGGASQDGAKSVLAGLTSAGFVAPGDVPGPSDLALVVTGGALPGIDAGDSAAVLARFAAQLDRLGRGGVLVGTAGSADATGAVGVARADPGITATLSTVDDAQSGSGRVSAVLALREQIDGHAGRYGVAGTAADGASPKA
jgi:hypothetical protein